MTGLRDRLASGDGPLIRAASAWDGLSALAAREAGCGGIVVSGASVSVSRLALPDLGFVTIDDLESVTRAVVAASGLPVLVDIDTGFGNAATAVRAAQRLAAVGASGVIVEDQVRPKRCGALPKDVVDVESAQAVVHELDRHRPSAEFVVVARTDALAVNGFDDAIDRVRRFTTAGADLAYVQGATSMAQVERLGRELAAPCFQIVGPETAHVDDQRWVDLGFAWITHAAVTETAMLTAARTALRASLEGRAVDVTISGAVLSAALDASDWMAMGEVMTLQEAPDPSTRPSEGPAGT